MSILKCGHKKEISFIYCYRYCNVIKLIYKLINKDEEKKQRHPIL